MRLLLSEIHNQEIAKRAELSEDDVLNVLSSAVKKHKDSIAQFQSGGRDDLVEQETAELRIAQSYLPPQMSREEVQALVRQIIIEVRPQGEKDFGKVMQKLMPQVRGRAPGSAVSQIVKEELQRDAP